MVGLDTKPPVVTISAPTSGAIVSLPGVMVQGTVGDPGVGSVLLTVSDNVNNSLSQTVFVSGGVFSRRLKNPGLLSPARAKIRFRCCPSFGWTQHPYRPSV